MTEVFGGAAVLALVVVIYVVFGARRGGVRGMDRTHANAALFSDRRRELMVEGGVQALDASTLTELEEELALDLIETQGAEPGDPAPAGTSRVEPEEAGPEDGRRPSIAAVASASVALAAVALGLYAMWGEPRAPALARAADVLAGDALDDAALARAEEALSARVGRSPEDANTWFLLGHSRMRLSDYSGAEEAFGHLRALAGQDAEIDAVWAQASYLAAGGMNEETREVVAGVLAARPDHPAMLEMMAMESMRQGEFGLASGYLARATAQPLPESRLALLTQLMTVARAQLDPARPLIEVVVKVEGEMRWPWLIVFARPVEGGMPLAIVRRRAETAQTVVLDDTVGMGPASRLSMGGSVEVVARLSETGNAVAGEGDLEVSSQPVDPQAQPQVELTFGADGVAVTATVIVEVSLDAEFDVDPRTPVFVIARDTQGPGPPLAVKRIAAGDLPARVELTDADAMLPGRGLQGAETLELVARVALGGSATAVHGDIESAAWSGRPADLPVRLHIDRQLP